MASANLYDAPVSYPTISAVDNGKLEFSVQDRLSVNILVADVRVMGVRKTTSDPWTIEIIRDRDTPAELTFALPSRSVNPDDLHWKSMADLAVKMHGRPTAEQHWPLVANVNMPIVTVDATDPSGYKGATLAEAAAIFDLHVDEAGDFVLDYRGTTTTMVCAKGVFLTAIQTAIASILNNGSRTDVVVNIPYAIVDLNEGESVSLRHVFHIIQASGTESISVGNYSYGDAVVTLSAGGATSGIPYSEHRRAIKANEAMSFPSIVVDKLRRSVKASGASDIEVEYGPEGVTMRNRFRELPYNGNGDAAIMYASAASPSGYFEVDFDQANSLNVLATAAFAGLGGLAASATAQQLEQLLANSPLSALFANVATALGATTSAVITGYVSALIASYTQGWISNDQLFNLSNHIAWLQAGAGTIVAAASAGVAIGELPTLLSYLGVNNNILGVAMTAVGGAATGAGVALGMASVMAKCVRHMYWGA